LEYSYINNPIDIFVGYMNKMASFLGLLSTNYVKNKIRLILMVYRIIETTATLLTKQDCLSEYLKTLKLNRLLNSNNLKFKFKYFNY